MARFDIIYGFLTELVRDELGLLPRPLTYLLFPADQSSLLKCLASLSLTRSMGFSWSLAGFLLPQPKQKSTSESPSMVSFPPFCCGVSRKWKCGIHLPSTAPIQEFFLSALSDCGVAISLGRKSLLDRNGQRSGKPVLVGFLQRSAGSKAKLGRSWGHEGCSYCACVVKRWWCGEHAYSYSIQ